MDHLRSVFLLVVNKRQERTRTFKAECLSYDCEMYEAAVLLR